MAQRARRRSGWWLAMLLVAGGACGAGTCPVAGAGLETLDCSLKFVPDNAAFYSITLKSGERFKAIAQSRAWAKIRSLPLVQMGLNMYQLQSAIPGSWANQIEVILADPEVKPVVDLVADMFSQEVFVYGDKDFAEFISLLQGLSTSMRFGGIARNFTGQSSDPQAQLGMILSYLHEEMDQIKVPGLIVGFRLSDVGRARKQLNRLEELVKGVSEAVPQLKGRFQRTKVGRYEYLTLALDGKLLPWKGIAKQLKDAEEEEGQAKAIIDRLKKLTLSIALGVRENYLLLAIGANNELLGTLGQDNLLVHRGELKPLAKHAGESIAAISFVSQEFKAAVANNRKDMDEMARWLIDDILPQIPVDDDQHKRIEKDVKDLAQDLKGLLPEAGAASTITFFKDHALETYGYDWTKYPKAEGGKPLGLLAHVGGDPVLAIIGAGRCSVSDYDVLVKWVRTAYGYFQDFAVPEFPPDGQKKFKKFMSRSKPLLKQIDDATRNQLIPALATGQVSFALDGKLKSKRFLGAAPATEKSMPMAEPAFVFAISNAELLRKAGQQYRLAINGILRALHEADPDSIQEMEIPEPQTAKMPAGTLYYFNLPAEWDLDKQILPNAALSDTVLCFSASKDHAQRLLKNTPLKQPGVLANAGLPRVGGLVLDWPALVDTAAPWVRLATEIILQKQVDASQEKGPQETQPTAIKPQVETLLSVLKVLRTITAEARLENGVTVEHERAEIRDLER